MAEGLSATEVGKEIGKHARRHKGDQGDSTPHERLISISEAILLSVVTIVAAWSGFSAAKWGTESSLTTRQGFGDAHSSEPLFRRFAHLPSD